LPGSSLKIKDSKPVRKAQQGAALVEFALVLPFFLVLLFGVLEFTLIMHAKGTLTQGAQAGARFGATYSNPPKTVGEIKDYVFSKYLQDAGLSGITRDNVVPVLITDLQGDHWQVQVNYTYQSTVLPVLSMDLTALAVCNTESH